MKSHNQNANGHATAHQRTYTREQVERWVGRARDTGGYFPFFRKFARLLTKMEALFLQDLYNRRQMTVDALATWMKKHPKRRPPVDEEGFFRCTVSYLQNPRYLVWSPQEQKTMIRGLKAKGYIKTRLGREVPRRRWVLINIVYMEEQLDAAEA